MPMSRPPTLSSVARREIVEFFDDSRMSAHREFTASRAEETAGSWFLGAPSPPSTSSSPRFPARVAPEPLARVIR